jgi:acyl carrier protein
MTDDRYRELGRLFADFLDRGHEVYSGAAPAPSGPGWGTNEPVVVTGAGLGLPGGERVFDDMNVAKILRGEQFIDLIPSRFRSRMVDKNIVRLVKGEDGAGSFQTIDNTSEVIKLAARAGALDVVAEYGIDEERNKALDVVTKLAIGAGFDALRDAGIPLVMHYKTTSIGTQLATRWALPDAMRDDTGVILASAFPGIDAFADEVERYVVDRERHRQLDQLAAIRARVTDGAPVAADIDRRINELRATLEAEPYLFNRRFLFKALSMGHAQFGEIIGARGPNTQINSACASTTQAIAIAQDWINAGRCRRVIVISGDDATSEHLMEWIGSGFLASGAAATDDVVENAALPFDNRRHGMIIGMGAAALVVEAAEAARERGIQPIAEILGSVTANSAFHGSRLDIEHISGVMEDVVSQAEARGVRRHDIAPETVFVSHETYTPARGGSAAAEINALRSVFGADADRIVIANTKGFTGHPMAVGVEDITAVKMLETGIIPPIPNFKEIDPALGALNLSKGGAYPVQYALRLAAGFGSQISMALFRWTPMPDRARRSPENLGYLYRIIDAAAWQDWLTRMTGYPDAQLEVVQRRLRVADVGAPVRKAEPARIAATAAVPTASVPASEAVDELPTPLAPTVPAPVPAQAPAPAPAPVPVATAAPAAVADPVTDKVLAVVAEVTGYPEDMLALELDLEADLGVDTVKQAEVFATIRETFGIERDENLKLRDYPTLEAVIGFVRDRAGIPAPSPAPVAPAPVAVAPAPVSTPAPSAAPAAPVADPVTDKVLSVVSEVTGYPEDMLDLELDLEADLGVDTVKQAEVFATIRETFGIERDENLKLRDYPTLQAVIGFVRDRAGIPAPSAAPAAAPAVPVQASAPAPAPTSVPAAPVADSVTETVLSVVAEVTGYPQDMLDLELDLEADLGVDTVKQAEVFATIRETFGIERDENLKLRDYPTLAAVIGFVRDRAGIPAPSAAVSDGATAAPDGAAVGDPMLERAVPAAGSVEAPAAPAPVAAEDPVVAKVLEVVADKTGYPPEMLDLDLDLEADLGVDTVKQAEVFATIREHFGIERDENLKLRDYPTLAAVIGFVRDRAHLEPPATPAGSKGQVAAEAAVAAPEPEAPAAMRIVGSIEAADRVPRRVPVSVLRPPLGLTKSTGVSLSNGARVVVAADKGGVADALIKRLRKLDVQVLSLDVTADNDAASTGSPAWTRPARWRPWTCRRGARPCAAGSRPCTPPCASSTTATRSWFPPPGSGGVTGTTSAVRSTRSVGPSPASPSPTSGRRPTSWSRPSTLRPAGRPPYSPTGWSTRRWPTPAASRSGTPTTSAGRSPSRSGRRLTATPAWSSARRPYL